MKILWEPDHQAIPFRSKTDWDFFASDLNKPGKEYFFGEPERYPCLFIRSGTHEEYWSSKTRLEGSFLYDFKILDYKDEPTPREMQVLEQIGEYKHFHVSRARINEAINGGGSFQLGDLDPIELEAILRLALKAKLLGL